MDYMDYSLTITGLLMWLMLMPVMVDEMSKEAYESLLSTIFFMGGSVGAWFAYRLLGNVERIGTIGALIGAIVVFWVAGNITKVLIDWLLKLLKKLLPWLSLLFLIAVIAWIVYYLAYFFLK
jgi:hypothetical protein